MRSLSSIFLIAAAFALPTVFAPIASHADPYRWCAVYGGGSQGGGTNCGFITLEQCRATISGMGGWCQPNQFYDGQPYDERPSKRPRKRTN
jgi:uncharacterized protein DUF3551